MFNPAYDIDISAGGPKFRGKHRRPRDGEMLSRAAELHFGREMTVAWMYVAADGGQVRRIITGRHRKPTGRLTLIKAGYRGMAWESMKGELPFLEMAEVATPIHSVLVQPHRLEMNVMRSDVLWDYTPDARLVVDAPFATDLVSGIPFGAAIAAWRPDRATGETRTVIVEIKTDADPRLADPHYRTKLRLASEVYVGLGWSFVEFVESRDLGFAPIRHAVRKFFLRRNTVLSPMDIQAAQECVWQGSSLGDLLRLFGEGPLAIAKVAALHCRRIICVELDRDLAAHGRVHLVSTGAK